MNPTDNELKKILRNAKTIAMVGASNRKEAPSHHVMEFLQDQGYNVYPINPNEDMVCGERCYGSLADVPVTIDIVDVFRRSEYTPAIVREAVEVGVPVVWLQEGIDSEEAALIAEDAGITLVTNMCIAKAIRRLMPEY